jgi:Fic family protein
MTPLRRREALTSSALEGTYATPEQLVLFEMGEKPSDADSGSPNEWREVANYHRALNQGIQQLKSGMPFCLRLFRELHATLLHGIPTRYKSPGEFRGHQVAIGSDRRYIPPPVSHLNQCLNDLENFINDQGTGYDPLVKAFLVHYQFEAVHPFYDGNGRIGRVLLSLMISKWRNESAPWLYMSAFFERFKDEYIQNMYRISANGEWDKWVEFCLRGTIRQAKDSVRRCDKLKELQTRFQQQIEADCSPRTHQIINGLFKDPIVFRGELQKRFKVTYPTAKTEVDRLVNLGILSKVNNQRPLAYYSPEIFTIAYGTDESALT